MQLADNQTGILFTVPLVNWTIINNTVGVSFLIGEWPVPQLFNDDPVNIYFPYGGLTSVSTFSSDIVKTMIPAFVAIRTWYFFCLNWRASTFLNIIAQANSMASYTATAIADFTNLYNSVKTLSPSDLVPDTIKNQTIDLLTKLSQSTAAHLTSFQQLADSINDFLAAYTDAATKYNQFLCPHGAFIDYLDTRDNQFLCPFGGEVSYSEEILNHHIPNFTNAVELVIGAWNAISNDINSIINNHIPVTYPFLLSLNLEAAIQSWRCLNQEATDFPAMANPTTSYWTNVIDNVPM